MDLLASPLLPFYSHCRIIDSVPLECHKRILFLVLKHLKKSFIIGPFKYMCVCVWIV